MKLRPSVVQRRRGLGFPLETAEGLCVVGEVVGKEFQGDMTSEFQVFRLIHHTHPPAADLAQDAVMGDRLPHGLGGCGHLGRHVRWGRGEGQRSVYSVKAGTTNCYPGMVDVIVRRETRWTTVSAAPARELVRSIR
jgi:hypothetical protein